MVSFSGFPSKGLEGLQRGQRVDGLELRCSGWFRLQRFRVWGYRDTRGQNCAGFMSALNLTSRIKESLVQVLQEGLA